MQSQVGRPSHSAVVLVSVRPCLVTTIAKTAAVQRTAGANLQCFGSPVASGFMTHCRIIEAVKDVVKACSRNTLLLHQQVDLQASSLYGGCSASNDSYCSIRRLKILYEDVELLVDSETCGFPCHVEVPLPEFAYTVKHRIINQAILV